MTARKSGPGRAFFTLFRPPAIVPGRFLTSLTTVSAMFSSPAHTSNHFFRSPSDLVTKSGTRWLRTQYRLPSTAVTALSSTWTSAYAAVVAPEAPSNPADNTATARQLPSFRPRHFFFAMFFSGH